MTREEAVQKLAKAGRLSVAHAEDLYDSIIPKPVVPQFVADWLEKNDFRKDTSGSQTIFDVFDNLTLDASNGYYDDVKKWVEENDNIFAKAWLFGYEVEKEPRYTVKLKNQEIADYLVKTDQNGLRFYNKIYTDRRIHTRKELEEAGFGWVFNCEGVEVEEVEE